MKPLLKIILSSVLIIVALSRCELFKPAAQETTFIPANHPNFFYLGRFDSSDPGVRGFAHTASSIKFSFEGNVCIIHLSNKSSNRDLAGEPYKNYYNLIVDQQEPQVIEVSNSDQKINLKLASSAKHTVELFKRTESLVGEGIFAGVELKKGQALLPVTQSNLRKVEFIGDSITCGYGNLGASKDCVFSSDSEDGYQAYGAIAARMLAADYVAVAYSGGGIYQNFDESYNKALPLIYNKILPDRADSPEWDFSKWQPDLVVVNLGTNDFAREIPKAEHFVLPYTNFLKQIRTYYPRATILCIEGPMIADGVRREKLKKYIELARLNRINAGDSKIHTFFLTAQTTADYACSYHPNLNKHRKMAEELVPEIKRIMGW